MLQHDRSPVIQPRLPTHPGHHHALQHSTHLPVWQQDRPGSAARRTDHRERRPGFSDPVRHCPEWYVQDLLQDRRRGDGDVCRHRQRSCQEPKVQVRSVVNDAEYPTSGTRRMPEVWKMLFLMVSADQQTVSKNQRRASGPTWYQPG